MDFLNEDRLWGAQDLYADSKAGSDEEDETLSLCDLPEMSAEWANALRDSNHESSNQEDFDFDFGRSISVSYHTCPADDLFHDGHLLPFAESNALFPYSKSNSFAENRVPLNENLQAWRSDSLESRSSYWTSSSSNNSRASQRNLNYAAAEKAFRPVNSNVATSKSKSKAHRISSTSVKPPPSRSQTSLKWQQVLTRGFIRTPVMNLEDIRLRQQKPNNNGADKLLLKQSVSCSSDEGPLPYPKEPRALNFQQKSRSVKGKMNVQETPRAKKWMKLATLASLMGCKASANSIIKCSTSKKPA